MTSVARTNRNGKRPASDFYPTPAEATLAWLCAEWPAIRRLGAVWDPAAGNDAILLPLRAAGVKTVATDLFDQGGRAKGRRDFLKERRLRAPAIATNPPYKIASAFARHALTLAPKYLALLLPITFMAGLKRCDVLDGKTYAPRLARVLVLAWRCTMKPPRLKLKNRGVTTYAWFVWTCGHVGPAVISRLYRPGDRGAA